MCGVLLPGTLSQFNFNAMADDVASIRLNCFVANKLQTPYF